MKRLNTLGLGLAGAVVAAAIVMGLVAMQVSAQDEMISIGSATAAPEEQGSVALEALDIGAPGLGAWTVDITYDSDVVSVADCVSHAAGVCNPAYADETIRATGAVATGLEGDTTLATITFECGESEGSSTLDLAVQVLADATAGDPQDIDAAEITGSFTCTAATATATATPTATGVTAPTATATVVPPPPTGDLAYVVAGATYDGAIEGGGTVRLKVTDDGQGISSIEIQGLSTSCVVATQQVSLNPPAAIDEDGVFIAPMQAGSAEQRLFLTIVGTFKANATIEGVILYRAADPVCGQGARSFLATATTAPVTSEVAGTSAAPDLPEAGASGGGGWYGGSALNWLIAGLAGAGIAWLTAGLAGAGLASVAGSGAPRPRSTEEPRGATATPTFRPLRMRAREESSKATTTTTSAAASQHEPGAGAALGGGSALNWLISAREQLASAGLAAVPGFGTRRRPRRP